MYSIMLGNDKCTIQNLNKTDLFGVTVIIISTDIFEIGNANNELVSFIKLNDKNDSTLSSAQQCVFDVCKDNYSKEDIESLLGRWSVSFPIFDNVQGVSKCHCENIISIVLLCLRYLSMNNYKFLLCEHCGKPFCIPKSRKTSRTKYCNRFSPCILDDGLDYRHLHCEQATRNIKQQLSRMKKRCYNTFYGTAEYAKTSGENLITFQQTCDLYRGCDSQTLISYYNYLKDILSGGGAHNG